MKRVVSDTNLSIAHQQVIRLVKRAVASNEKRMLRGGVTVIVMSGDGLVDMLEFLLSSNRGKSAETF